MGRGKDKTISGKDIPNMSPREQAGLATMARMGRVKITGTAVVRKADGNAKYSDPKKAGSYGEDKL